jgi:hypothetical protein
MCSSTWKVVTRLSRREFYEHFADRGAVPTSRALSSIRDKIKLVKRKIESTRIIRGRPTARDVSGWENADPDERFAAVWELSRLVMEWSGHGEPRLQRSVCRVQRS